MLEKRNRFYCLCIGDYMRQHKILYFFVLAFLFITVACGDDSSASADSDDESSSSYVEDSSSSKSKNSSSSKKDSSSSSSKSDISSSTFKPAYDASKVKKGTFVDKRDGHEYKTITIDEQTWMAENLNYAPASSLGCHKGDNKDCSKYGRIYTWGEVIDSTKSFCGFNIVCDNPLQGICPDGWRIPRASDWGILLNKLYGSSPSFFNYGGLAPYLLSKDNEPPYDGVDSYGFSVSVPPKENSVALNFFMSTQSVWSSGKVTPEFVVFNYYGVDDNNFTEFTTPAMLRCIKGDLIPDINRPTTTFGVRGDDRKVCGGAEPQSFISTMACNKNGKNECTKKEDGSVKIGRWWHGSVEYGPFEMLIVENGKKECPFEWHIPNRTEWSQLLYTVGGSCFAGYTLKAQEGWGDDYALDAFGVGIKPTDDKGASFFIGGPRKGEILGRVVFAKGSNIAKIEDDTSNVSGLLCMKGRLIDDTLSLMNPKLEYGSFTDTRDNRTYKTINIGHTQWMAENLNYATDSSICYKHSKDDFYCNRYGRFYLHEDAQTACPAGWRLPTKEEFDTLVYIGAPYRLARYLVSEENTTYKGNNNSGFSLILMGYMWNGRDDFGDAATYLWSSTRASDTTVYTLSAYKVSYTDSAFVSKAYDKKGSKFNVRCVSEEKVRYGYMGTYGTLTDSRDGHEYKTVEINGTTWMAENLDYASSTASCHRDSCDINGMHYTYPFLADTLESLCPEGWHISTTADWDSLLAFVRAKDSLNYAYDLKDPFAWPSYEKGNDKYGFGLLPNTCYYDNSGYDLVNVRDESVACIGAESPDGNAGYYYIHSTNNVNSIYRNIYKRNIQKDSRFRYGIRCVKDK